MIRKYILLLELLVILQGVTCSLEDETGQDVIDNYSKQIKAKELELQKMEEDIEVSLQELKENKFNTVRNDADYVDNLYRTLRRTEENLQICQKNLEEYEPKPTNFEEKIVAIGKQIKDFTKGIRQKFKQAFKI